jgi:hypothetical protein
LWTAALALTSGARTARFISYGEYSPDAGAKSIPVVMTATAVKGEWQIDLSVDVPAAKRAFAGQ